MAKRKKLEVWLDNQKIRYTDKSFLKDLEAAMKEKEGMTYVGSSCIYYENGVRKRHPYRLHFFKRSRKRR